MNIPIEFKVMPGKWKYLALIRSGSWQFLTPDEEGGFTINNYKTYSAGTVYLAASETEFGTYETIAEFFIK